MRTIKVSVEAGLSKRKVHALGVMSVLEADRMIGTGGRAAGGSGKDL